MQASRWLFVIAASGLLAGCASGGDQGAPIPQRSAASEQQIRSMPPEAQHAAQSAARAGDYQAQRMREMAEAQRKASGGR